MADDTGAGRGEEGVRERDEPLRRVRGGGWTWRRELGDPLRQGGDGAAPVTVGGRKLGDAGIRLPGVLLLAGGAVDEEGRRGGAEERGGAFEEGGCGGYLGFAAGSVEGNRERRSSARPAHGTEKIKKPGTATVLGRPDGPKALRAC
jgi:hypothetical protein